jgi:hypothetical protein
MLKESLKICLIILLLLPFLGCEKEDDSKFNVITFASIVGKYKGSSSVCTIFPIVQDTICTSAVDNTMNIFIMNKQNIVTSDESGLYGRDTLSYIKTEVINGGNRFLFSKSNLSLVYHENDKQVVYEDKDVDGNTEISNIFTGKK